MPTSALHALADAEIEDECQRRGPTLGGFPLARYPGHGKSRSFAKFTLSGRGRARFFASLRMTANGLRVAANGLRTTAWKTWYVFYGYANERRLTWQELAGGDDGTRTRDLMRDRHAF